MTKGTKVTWTNQNGKDLDGNKMSLSGEGTTSDDENAQKRIHVLVQSEGLPEATIHCMSGWLTPVSPQPRP